MNKGIEPLPGNGSSQPTETRTESPRHLEAFARRADDLCTIINGVAGRPIIHCLAWLQPEGLLRRYTFILGWAKHSLYFSGQRDGVRVWFVVNKMGHESVGMLSGKLRAAIARLRRHRNTLAQVVDPAALTDEQIGAWFAFLLAGVPYPFSSATERVPRSLLPLFDFNRQQRRNPATPSVPPTCVPRDGRLVRPATPERRATPRWPIKLRVRVGRKGQPFVSSEVSATANVSSGGICFPTPRKYRPGELLEIEVPFAVERVAVPGTAVVTRQEDPPGATDSRVAVKFNATVSAEDRQGTSGRSTPGSLENEKKAA